MDKDFFRKKYRQLRKELDEATIEELSLEIANNALSLAIWDATYYHIFLSIEGKKEVNTEFIMHILQGKDKSIVLSKSDFNSLEMTHYLLQENTVLKASEFGIPEPENGLVVAPELFDIIFIPLLAFDRSGNRIGYGKGFYDRFLRKCRPDSVKIGLSLFQAEPEIIHENMDFPLDYCITPKKIYTF